MPLMAAIRFFSCPLSRREERSALFMHAIRVIYGCNPCNFWLLFVPFIEAILPFMEAILLYLEAFPIFMETMLSFMEAIYAIYGCNTDTDLRSLLAAEQQLKLELKTFEAGQDIYVPG